MPTTLTRFFAPALLALVVSTPAAAGTDAAAGSRWMKVLLDGRKVGQLQSERTVEGDRVTSIERMRLSIDRAGISLAVTSEERSVETLDGQPLSFESRSGFSGVETVVEGRVEGATVHVVLRSGKSEQRRSLPWPEGAVLAEGARLAEARHGLTPGTRYAVLSFQPSNLAAFRVEAEVVGTERIDLGMGLRELVRVDQTADLQGTPLRMSAWVDDAIEVQRATLPLMGMVFELVACSEACATAPNQPLDVLDGAMVAAPRALTATERAAGLRYRLELAPGADVALPSVGEQVALRERGAWTVEVQRAGVSAERSAPMTADREPTRWLNYDDPSVAALAKTAAGTEPPRDRDVLMRRLESFVRAYIDNKSMRIGYASAAETVASREGDCTEHAVLLAALGRSLGIPTRVVNGLAYAPEFAGRDRVFVPHAWVQAHDGTRWRSYDAALAGFDAGHIALSIGDGDAVGFYAGVALLGNVEVESVEPLPEGRTP